MAKKFAPGDRVKFTGKFLACTGQGRGSAGLDVFVIQACSCKPCAEGRWVATNHPDMPHLAAGNLYKVGTLSLDNIDLGNANDTIKLPDHMRRR